MKKCLLIIQLSIVISLFIVMNTSCEKEERNTPPVANFTFSPETGSPISVFTFDASSSTDSEDLPGTLVVRWDWESDGLFDTDFSTNKILEHQYSIPGTYHVTLEVKDSKELGNSVTKSVTVEGHMPEVLTDTISNITAFSAFSGGNVISDDGIAVTVRGVCWSTDPNPTIDYNFTTDGSGKGHYNSVITGLSISTTYYVRAYATNNIGTAYGNQVEFTTPYQWLCGDLITANHVEGDVAPVSKVVTYGTVTDIPGEPSKCWITSNLGADHQAGAVDDATEESAGWYFQFNRKQGYKHDGTTRTPNTAWITSIEENSEWITGNDPCAIELGDEWHIPTMTEWTNVKEYGGWYDWNNPWNSPLKLHAGGHLFYTTGLLTNRGIRGSFWSITEGSFTGGWYIIFDSGDCHSAGLDKEYGLTLRCIRD